MSKIGFADDVLISMTRNAIEYSFLDDQKRKEVLTKLN
jgi:adenosine deaminase